MSTLLLTRLQARLDLAPAIELAALQRGPWTYLLHFHDRHGRAQHLLWYSQQPFESLVSNYCGSGHGLIETMIDRGIRFELVNCWPGGWSTRETIRKAHNNRRFCYRCCYGRARQLPLFRLQRGEQHASYAAASAL